MTLKNSSLNKTKNKAYKKCITPATVVTFIGLLLFYVSAIVLYINRSRNYGELYHQLPETIRLEQLNAVSKIIGFRQVGIVFVIALAIIYALLEFGYLFSRQQLDFYLSQPTSNRKRFIKRYIHGFISFACIYATVIVLALLMAAALRSVSMVLIYEALLSYVYVLAVFLAFYNITVLGIMLSGSFFTALVMTAFISVFFSIVAMLIHYYSSMFFITYSSLTKQFYILSPVYDVITVVNNSSGVFGYQTASLSMADLRAILSGSAILFVDIAATAVIAFIFAVIAYKKRKTEWAGKTICFGFVQKFFKISVSIIAGMVVGLLVDSIYPEYSDSKTYLILAGMVIGTVLIALIIECFIKMDIKAFYSGIFETICAVAIVVVIFVCCDKDVFGYDSYIPAEDEYSSYFLVKYASYGYMSQYSNYSYTDLRALDLQKRMFLTDKEAMNEVAQLSIDHMKNWNYPYENGWSVEVGYRLNSGRVVYRTLCIPYEVDSALMDRIIGSDEYVQSYFDVFFEYDNEDRIFTDATFDYSTEAGSAESKTASYAEFKEAYAKDVSNYNFTLASTEPFEGVLNIYNYSYSDDNYSYTDVYYPVYSCYTNTIQFLKDNDLYVDAFIDFKYVSSVKVDNYYPGMDLEEYEDISDIVSVDTVSETYTDQESYEEIMAHAICSGRTSDWYSYDKLNEQYGITVEFTIRNDTSNYYSSSYFMFKKGEVPEFVVQDTNK